MEKGQMRLEANISLKKSSQSPLPNYKVEIKNINSFRYLHDAIVFEINRQTKLLSANKKIVQETRRYNAAKKATFSQRSKEEAYEYRYFPEPDIPPLNLEKLFNLKKLAKAFPRLPEEIKISLQDKIKITEYQSSIISRKQPQKGEAVLKIAVRENVNVNDVANAIINRTYPLEDLTPQEFIDRFKKDKQINLVSGKKLTEIVQKVIKKQPKAVADYKTGKKAALDFLIGKVQQETRGKADVNQAKKLLAESLKNK